MSELRGHRIASDGKPDFSLDRLLKDAEENRVSYDSQMAELDTRAALWKERGIAPKGIYNLWDLKDDGYTWHNKYHNLYAYVRNDAECTHLWFEQDEMDIHTRGCYHHVCSLYDYIECLQTLRLQAYERGILTDPEFKGKL